jgi:membrane protein
MARASMAGAAEVPAKAVKPVTSEPPRWRLFFWHLLPAEFTRNEVLLRASSLAYGTIASLVPIIAIVLAVLSGPAFQTQREAVLDALAEGMVPSDNATTTWVVNADTPEQEHFKEVFRAEIEKLASRLGAVSIFGFLLLLATAGMLFRQVEAALNAIWSVGARRGFFMRIAVATSVIFWGPVMLAVSIAITEQLGTWLPFLGTYVLPSILTTLVFTSLYTVLPHAPVKFRHALIGGAMAAFLWEVAKFLFLLYVTRVVSYSRVYGSLGLIPMLFLWVYISWVLVLLGAEIAYCVQNWSALRDRWLADRLSTLNDKRGIPDRAPPSLVLAVAIEIARRFTQPGGGSSVTELASALSVEPALIRDATERLLEAKILARVDRGDEEETAYLPASDPAACEIVALIGTACDEQEPLGKGEAAERAWNLLQEMGRARVSGGLTLASLAAPTQPAAPAQAIPQGGATSNPESSSVPG